jgi:hypothetical protein
MPYKMENQQLVSPSRKSSSTPVGFSPGFLSKEQCDNTGASPDLAHADFYLFPRVKSALKERRFDDATDTIKNATEELKRFLRNGFHECFQQLDSRWQESIVSQEDYFEGNLA